MGSCGCARGGSTRRFSRLVRYLLGTAAMFGLAGGLCSRETADDVTPPGLTLERLLCEGRTSPLGIDTPKPRFSWWLKSDVRGQRQIAYRVIVARSNSNLAAEKADTWDSGRVSSDQSIHVEYAGEELESGGTYWWKARAWDKDGQPSPWSEATSFTMGLLEPDDWKGRWIGPRQGKPALTDSGLGYHAQLSDRADDTKWVQLDLGRSVPVDSVTLHALNHDGVPGFGFPPRFRVEVSDDPSSTTFRAVADHSGAHYPNPGHAAVPVGAKGMPGRYVRLTASRLWQRPHGDRKYCFGLAELEVLSSGTLVSRNAKIAVKDSTECCGWGMRQLNDGRGLVPDPEAESRLRDAEAVLRGETPEDPRHAAILMRREISLGKTVRRATAFFSGLGWSELYVDGRRVGDAVLSPPFSSYHKSVNYVVHDVTPMLSRGTHALGVQLGNGWMNTPSVGYLNVYTNKPWTAYPKLLLDLAVEYEDGTRERFVSDEKWKWSVGEITWNDGWHGEDVDMRLAKPGWATAGYDDRRWKPVVPVVPPGGRLMAQMVPPIRVCETIKPAHVEEQNGVYTFTLPRLYSGWPRIETRGNRGSTITVTWGNENRGTFTLSGNGTEVYEPKFCYEAIHKIRVSGLRHPPVDGTVVARAVRTDVATVGGFECSDAYLNQLHNTVCHTQLNYTYDFPQDPTREKCGWTQDVETMLEASAWNFDMKEIYRNWFKDFREAQNSEGCVNCCAPGDFNYAHLNGPWWGGMIVWGPWHHYQYYGDLRVLEENYGSMKRFVDFMSSKAGKDGVLGWGLGDWNCPGVKTPVAMTSTAAYSFYARIISNTARLLGRKDDITTYAALSDRVRERFNDRWLDRHTGCYMGNHQTVQVLAWSLDLVVPRERRWLVLGRLVDDITTRGYHLDTGFVGTPYLVKTLVDAGRADVLCRMTRVTDSPGWHALTRDGVLMEDWKGGGVPMPSCGGCIDLLFFRGIAGIEQAAGLRTFIIKPQLGDSLTWARAHHDSPYGRIASSWRRKGNRLDLNLVVPPNTRAIVHVPATEGVPVTESGRDAAQAPACRLLGREDGRMMFEIGSGAYEFSSSLR